MTSTLSKLRLCFIHFLPSEITSATLGLTFILIIEPSRLPLRILAARVPLLTNLSRRFYSAVVSSTLPWMFVSSPLVATQQTYPRGCALTSTVCCQRKPGIWWSVPLVLTHLTSCRYIVERIVPAGCFPIIHLGPLRLLKALTLSRNLFLWDITYMFFHPLF